MPPLMSIFLPYANILFFCSAIIRIWKNDMCVSTLKGHRGQIKDICIFKKKWIVSASFDKTLRVWSISKGKYVKSLEGHKLPVMCCYQ